MFEVSWCLLGVVPEAEPFMFHNYEEARTFLVSELFWFARDTQSTLENKIATEAGFRLKELKEGEEFSLIVGKIHYWLINRSEINSWLEY